MSELLYMMIWILKRPNSAFGAALEDPRHHRILPVLIFVVCVGVSLLIFQMDPAQLAKEAGYR